MTTRSSAPIGSPCWVDLWTSDVAASRRFYADLLGWQAQEPSPEFGGYFMFTRNGAPVAGGMGDMGDMKADNSWKVYLATHDMAKTLETAQAEGARVVAPAMTVADLGAQAVLIDPTGATVGVWQPETFQGFSVLDEPGAPDWFELQTRDYAKAVAFYRSAFGWGTNTVGDSDDFRYTVMRHPSGDGELAGIMDAGAFLPEGTPSHWSVYFEVDAIGTTVERAVALGGSVVTPPQDTPYGQLATLTDTAGAYFKLRSVKR